MENQTKTFTKKTELVFTTIEIEKYNTFGKKRFVAKFKSGDSKDNLTDKEEFCFNIDELLEELSKELGEINERHYIIK